MAILTAPLLSFTARGQLAKTITYRRSKRQDVASVYTVPTDPHTPAQLAQRNLVYRASRCWGTKLTDNQVREAWRRRGAITQLRFGPFAVFCHFTMSRPLTPDSFYIGPIIYTAWYPPSRQYSMKIYSLNNSGTLPVYTDFYFYAGTSPDNMIYKTSGNKDGSNIGFYPINNPVYPMYYEIRHVTGYPASGIVYRKSA